MERNQAVTPLPQPRHSSTHLLFRRALLAAVALTLVVLLREVWELAFLSIVLATLWSFPVGFLSRWMPRGLATLLCLGVFLTAIALVTPLIANPLMEQVKQAEESLPSAIQKAKIWLRHQDGVDSKIKPATAIAKNMEQKTANLEQGLAPAIVKGLSAGSSFALMFVLSLFFVYEPDTYRKYLRAAVPKSYEDEFDGVWARLGVGLRKWLGGIFISMTIMGSLTALGLLLIGVHNWLLLGALTFIGTFVPYVGALASAFPGMLLALTQSNEKFVLAGCVYLGVHIVEGYIVDPFVMRKAVTIQPAVLLIWQLTMGLCLGIFGFVIATPLYVCLKAAFDFLYVEQGLGKKPYEPVATGKQAS